MQSCSTKPVDFFHSHYTEGPPPNFSFYFPGTRSHALRISFRRSAIIISGIITEIPTAWGNMFLQNYTKQPGTRSKSSELLSLTKFNVMSIISCLVTTEDVVVYTTNHYCQERGQLFVALVTAGSGSS